MRLLRVLLGWLLVRRRTSRPVAPRPAESDPSRRDVTPHPGAERIVAALLFAAGALGVAFVVLYITRPNVQLLGLALGLGLASVAAALILAGARVAPQETAEEERPELERPEEEQDTVDELRRGREGVSRRTLLLGSAGAASAGLGLAAIVPLASLGPDVGQRIDQTPWHRGRRLVGDDGRPIHAEDVVAGSFLTAFPEGADPRELGSPVVVVRAEPSQIHLPSHRDPALWAPEGLLAYSKICTHAGCAVALYRKPTFPAVEPRAALVCPCHYSTFDPARGAKVIFGPAGRPLPQLPLRIDPDTRELRAGGGFSGSVGPAWWGVDRGT